MAWIYRIPLLGVTSWKWQIREFRKFPYLTHFVKKWAVPYLEYPLYFRNCWIERISENFWEIWFLLRILLPLGRGSRTAPLIKVYLARFWSRSEFVQQSHDNFEFSTRKRHFWSKLFIWWYYYYEFRVSKIPKASRLLRIESQVNPCGRNADSAKKPFWEPTLSTRETYFLFFLW